MILVIAKTASKTFRAHRRKIAIPLSHRGHGRRICLALAVAEAFVKSEEESLVFADGPTERPAELVLLEWLSSRREIVGGVKGVVAQKFPERAVESVGAGPRDDIGSRTQAVSEFRVRIVSQNL